MKNMKCPAYANTGFVTLMKAVTKLVFTVALILATGKLTPAPTMPTIPAIKILNTLGTLSQDSLSRVRGSEKMRVGMAKMPV